MPIMSTSLALVHQDLLQGCLLPKCQALNQSVKGNQTLSRLVATYCNTASLQIVGGYKNQVSGIRLHESDDVELTRFQQVPVHPWPRRPKGT